ncbi:hypothetical protein GALMADRAFT_1121386 [Galerina marginata CBS 339.88]|uniref:Uncharacterized protein n=1 Tax=Galerina marginata (strain CBS 339.88) TaxID=685588 RepID=A0A067TQ16_GALM3|nr:hypothetical protein GALMADRAFT_1121386 [Galerina marginata CBS 339.88]
MHLVFGGRLNTCCKFGEDSRLLMIHESKRVENGACTQADFECSYSGLNIVKDAEEIILVSGAIPLSYVLLPKLAGRGDRLPPGSLFQLHRWLSTGSKHGAI